MPQQMPQQQMPMQQMPMQQRENGGGGTSGYGGGSADSEYGGGQGAYGGGGGGGGGGQRRVQFGGQNEFAHAQPRDRGDLNGGGGPSGGGGGFGAQAATFGAPGRGKGSIDPNKGPQLNAGDFQTELEYQIAYKKQKEAERKQAELDEEVPTSPFNTACLPCLPCLPTLSRFQWQPRRK